jgi:serine/threonine-protein kinase
VRIVLADDAVLFRDALAGALRARGHEIVGQASDAIALVAQVATLDPDVAIVDIRMPPGDGPAGLDAALRIRSEHRRTAVLLLSHHVETVDVARLLGDDAAGVGYLLKDRVAAVDELDDALTRIAGGGSAIDPMIVAAWLGRARPHNPLDELTRRESEVLALMAEGRSNHGIGARLHLGTKTVESHVAAIFSKLNLEPADSDHRRVLAVITWLRTAI